MTLRLLPGARGEQLLAALDHLYNGAQNARSGDGAELYQSYIRWAMDAARSLGMAVSREDVERLVLTQRHWTLQGLTPGLLSTNLLVTLELERVVIALGEARDDLREQLDLWRAGREREHIVVPDTNIFLHHEKEFVEVPWEDIIKAGVDEPIHIVVPLVVIDELDQAKRRNDTRTRARARSALRHLDAMTLRPGRPRQLRLSSQDGPIDVRVLPEERGHVRLPRPDAELVDVVRGLRDLVSYQVTIITFDAGMVVRARAADVLVRKLQEVPPT